MLEIAEAVGISRATLHRRFPTREHLVTELASQAIADLSAITVEIEQSGRSGISAIELLIERAAGLVPVYGFLTKEPCLDELFQPFAAFDALLARWTVLVEAAQQLGEVRMDLPARWIVFSIQGMTAASFEATRIGYLAPRDVPRLVSQMLLNGMRHSDPTPNLSGSTQLAITSPPQRRTL